MCPTDRPSDRALPRLVPTPNALRSWYSPAGRIPRDLWIAWSAVALAFLPIFGSWIRDWRIDPNYSQGFLIPLISVFLGLRALRPTEPLTPEGERAARAPGTAFRARLVALGLLS